MDVDIVSTGHTPFGKCSEDIGGLMLNACNEALENANTGASDVDAIYISNFSSSFSNQCQLPGLLTSKLGVGNEITRVESACAAGGLAVKEAALAILSGLYDKVLVCGVEKMSETPTDKATEIIARASDQEEINHGATFPSLFALMAQRHFHEYGTMEEHLASVAVKNHKNALNNSLAQFQKEISVEKVMNSRYIASPLKIFDCSPLSDGASAVLMCRKELSRKYTDAPVNFAGMGHYTDYIGLYERKSLTEMPAVARAAKKAYSMSGLSPGDIGFAEVHDCFTIAELVEIEDLGFCKKGEGKNIVTDGTTEIDGSLPINPSGGLKAKGHPIGATGVSQVVEVVKQLQGDAGKRTISGVDTGLCCNIGGSGSSAVVSIFRRE
ncbi:MAG: thiolase domain-containing protein [Methanomicrobiaceae archaeon]|nr:thiolase domain-containing protein [Methanomicrobiaceae archaeon]